MDCAKLCSPTPFAKFPLHCGVSRSLHTACDRTVFITLSDIIGNHILKDYIFTPPLISLPSPEGRYCRMPMPYLIIDTPPRISGLGRARKLVY